MKKKINISLQTLKVCKEMLICLFIYMSPSLIKASAIMPLKQNLYLDLIHVKCIHQTAIETFHRLLPTIQYVIITAHTI